MLGNFDRSDILVFTDSKDTSNYEQIETLIPDMLSYDHTLWTGYVRSKNDRREDDDFTSHLKNICRG